MPEFQQRNMQTVKKNWRRGVELYKCDNNLIFPKSAKKT